MTDSSDNRTRDDILLTDGQSPSVAVGFLLRGADDNWLESAYRFLESYKVRAAGFPHVPHVLLKGFSDQAALEDIEMVFRREGFSTKRLADDGYDIMAYARWARELDTDYVCFFNTHSEILVDDWLAKFIFNLVRNDLGMVSATGSFESLNPIWSVFPRFPNAHLRSNAFCLKRALFTEFTANLQIQEKLDAFLFESGPRSISSHIVQMGKRIAIVGRNGRAYAPRWWPFSGTFRQRTQSNLLVADNVTRAYDRAILDEKVRLTAMTWGSYINEDYLLPLE